MTHDEAIAYLMQDGDLGVPCSRYGRRTSDCAEIAWEAAESFAQDTGEEITTDLLDHTMSLVVNDHDDIAYSLVGEAPLVFNMDLANGRTSARFCYEAAAVLGETIADEIDDDDEWISETVDEWTGKLEEAGYAVHWSMGDVVVNDLRGFSDLQKERYYEWCALDY